jgi:uncharacterized protein with HEPN domain
LTKSDAKAPLSYPLSLAGEKFGTKRLSTDFRNAHSHIPWKDIAGMCDILAHQYDRVNLDTLWDVIQNDIPELIELIAPLLPKQTP